jgi:hypothetical protein
MNMLSRTVRGAAQTAARHPGLLVAIVTTLLSVGLAEFVCWRINNARSRETVYSDVYNTFFPDDEALGYKPPSNVVGNITLRKKGRTVYDVVYSIDSYSRRLVLQASSGLRKQHALFFGCSFTFGDGVNDGDTLPAQFAKYSEASQVYNYAYSGYGPQHAVAHLQREAFSGEIAETNGVAFYVYLADGHEQRVIGSMIVYNSWGYRLPCYVLDRTGCLVRAGSFTSSRPWKTRLYRLLGCSQILKLAQADFPPFKTATRYRLTAAVLAEAAALYERRFPGGRFFVVIYPTQVKDLRILPFLRERGVRYLDYSALFDPAAKEYKLEGDAHPSPLAYATLAQRLAADIEKRADRNTKGPQP